MGLLRLLEKQLQRKLEIAGSARVKDGVKSRALVGRRSQAAVGHAGGGAECWTVQRSALRAETGVIEDIKHVGLKPQADPLTDGEIAV